MLDRSCKLAFDPFPLKHTPMPAPKQQGAGVKIPVQSELATPQIPVPEPVQQGYGSSTPVQAALSEAWQNPVPAPVQQGNGAAPVVQVLSAGGSSALNWKSTEQKSGSFSGTCKPSEGFARNSNDSSQNGGTGRGYHSQVFGQVVTTLPMNWTLGPSGLVRHTGSTPGTVENLWQSSPTRKLKT